LGKGTEVKTDKTNFTVKISEVDATLLTNLVDELAAAVVPTI
jgi:hypothetical protein